MLSLKPRLIFKPKLCVIFIGPIRSFTSRKVYSAKLRK
uniref:Uncharacterized protein n=1 Tax=Anguilla anguilla TaxID=7936 RepID=A0A0E9RE90_ANGAN